MKTSKILFVEDDTELREVMAELLRASGFSVYEAASVEDAKRACKECDFDVVLTDLRMPGGIGTSLIRWIKESGRNEKCVLFTGQMNYDDEDMKGFPPDLVLEKPVSIKRLELALKDLSN